MQFMPSSTREQAGFDRAHRSHGRYLSNSEVHTWRYHTVPHHLGIPGSSGGLIDHPPSNPAQEREDQLLSLAVATPSPRLFTQVEEEL